MTNANDVFRHINGVDFEGVWISDSTNPHIDTVKKILRDNFTKVRKVTMKEMIWGNSSDNLLTRVCFIVPFDELSNVPDEIFDKIKEFES